MEKYIVMKINLKFCLSFVLSALFLNVASAEIVSGLEFYGDLTLVDSIECATDTTHSFREFPAGRSYVSNILGQACIVMHHVKTSETSNGNESSAYISWRIGKGKNLVPSDPYLFVVEYPDDAPRSSTIINRGAPTRRGFHTGITVGDALSPPYVMNFPESYEIPLTQGFEKIEQVMYLVEKAVTYNEQGSRMDTSVEGFDIAFALFPQEDQKASHGVAIKSIKLYHINDEANLKAKITYPKGDTPRRVVTFREEMSDDGGHASFADPVQWYRNKGRLMSVLGMNTYSRDLLEFGYCQYWDPTYNNYGSGWMNYNYEMRGLWEQVVTVMGEQGHNLFPLYEYAGGRGAWDSLGNKKLVKPLFIDTKSDAMFNNQTYQEDCLVDITSPAAHDDFKKILDCTIIRFKDKANFLGSWIRSRGQMPVSFHENTVALFCQEKGYDPATVTRRYIADKGRSSDIYKEYMAWWYLKRVEFFDEMQKYLEDNGVANAKSFYTSCPAETGEYAENWWGGNVANNDTWSKVTGESSIGVGAATWNYSEYCLKLAWPTWGNYEFFHTTPADDPQNYASLKNVGLTYPFNRVYTVVGGYDKSWRNSSDDLFFVRHHSLNENALTDENGTHILGYYTADFEKAGRACMLSELWSMAVCDPTMIGYLFGYDLGRNNAKPVREFNQNFLALPATKSTVVSGGYWGADLTVRRWDTEESGTFFAIINTSANEYKNETISFTGNASEFKKVYRAVGGQSYDVSNGAITVDLQPLEMVTFTTEPPTKASITVAASEVAHNSAMFKVSVSSLGAADSAEVNIVITKGDDSSNKVFEYTEQITSLPATIEKALSELSPDTAYNYEVTITPNDGEIFEYTGSFTTLAFTAPELGELRVENLSMNSATFVLPVNSFGVGSESVSATATFSYVSDANTDETYTKQLDSVLNDNNEFVFDFTDLIHSTTYSCLITVTGSNQMSTEVESDITTQEFVVPEAGFGATTNLTHNAVTIIIPAADLYVGAESVTCKVVLSDGTTIEQELNESGEFVFNFTGLEPATKYEYTITAKGSYGGETVIESSFETARFPLGLSASTAVVNDDGKSATISASVDWVDAASAILILYVDDVEVKTWSNVASSTTYSHTIDTTIGKTYCYEFVLKDSANGATNTREIGSFVAQVINGWFAVKFEDEGYDVGLAWTNITAVSEPGGTWTKSEDDNTELVSDTNGKYLKLDNSSKNPLYYTPTTPSLEAKDVRIEGRAQFVSADQYTSFSTTAQIALQLLKVDEVDVLAVYSNGTWIELSGPAITEGKWYNYRFELDYSSAEAPRAQIFIDDNLYIQKDTGALWISLATSKRNVTRLGFAGTGSIGNVAGYYYDVLADEEEEEIVLVVPEIGSSSGSGLEFKDVGDTQVFSITIKNPVPGAYYTPFVVNDLRETTWVAAIDSVKAEVDGMLVLDVDSSTESSQFVKIVVSYPEQYKAGDEKTFE